MGELVDLERERRRRPRSPRRGPLDDAVIERRVLVTLAPDPERLRAEVLGSGLATEVDLRRVERFFYDFLLQRFRQIRERHLVYTYLARLAVSPRAFQARYLVELLQEGEATSGADPRLAGDLCMALVGFHAGWIERPGHMVRVEDYLRLGPSYYETAAVRLGGVRYRLFHELACRFGAYAEALAAAKRLLLGR